MKTYRRVARGWKSLRPEQAPLLSFWSAGSFPRLSSPLTHSHRPRCCRAGQSFICDFIYSNSLTHTHTLHTPTPAALLCSVHFMSASRDVNSHCCHTFSCHISAGLWKPKKAFTCRTSTPTEEKPACDNIHLRLPPKFFEKNTCFGVRMCWNHSHYQGTFSQPKFMIDYGFLCFYFSWSRVIYVIGMTATSNLCWSASAGFLIKQCDLGDETAEDRRKRQVIHLMIWRSLGVLLSKWVTYYLVNDLTLVNTWREKTVQTLINTSPKGGFHGASQEGTK